MSVTRILTAVLFIVCALPATGQQIHVVNAEARIFNPDVIYVQPGEYVKFVNMASHDTVSINKVPLPDGKIFEGMLPEGAEGWKSGMGNNITFQLDIEGVYPYVCIPHIGFGMVGVVVVGEPVNIDTAMESAKANLTGPYRRLIGKLLKVQRAAKKG
ncbi:MAG: plastocyanin/azurin family copper-binding protein [Gammaproteobacteria bacterium]|nr:plastocyanin/azurin family copper-binding protein [Gammaproteobacteria bacterium]MCY4283446.1 plastocyanin/azurin family copper-binding protein [Gammaproteobacteria bacterium]MCY4338690.1 plastocyanin/azurin family copper-binding protein [Gammaproteobacteria bacterium]